MHLTAQPITKAGDSKWTVKHGDDEIIVAETDSTHFVKDAIVALKMKGVPHETRVVILTDAGSAWNGSISQHGA